MFREILSYLATEINKPSDDTFDIQPQANLIRVDNDTNQGPGFGNTNSGFNQYLTQSYYFNGDARRATGYFNGNPPEYGWYCSTYSVGGKSIALQIYINDSSFQQPSALYYKIDSSSDYKEYGYVNQYSAPSAWFNVGSAYFFSGYPRVNVAGLNSGYYTGADGIGFTIP